MPTCFVIQPFDDKFNKRYDGTFRLAIEAAGLAPYRVDRDASVSIPIDEIESGIRGAAVCFADITLNNPNVWFEVGFAIALQKQLVLICSEERDTRYPFDVQHRTIIKYKTEAAQDYEDLSKNITSRLVAMIKKEARLEAASGPSTLRPVEGLDQIEIVALVAVGENIDAPGDLASIQSIRQDMERAGFRKIAVTISLGSLIEKEMLEAIETNNFNDFYTGYRLTSKGHNWLRDNRHLLILRRQDDVGPLRTIPCEELPP